MVRRLYKALGASLLHLSGNQSGWWVRPSVPLRGVPCCSHLSVTFANCAACYTGSTCRALQWFCRGTSGFGEVSSSHRSLSFQMSILLPYWHPSSLLCVHGGGVFALWLWVYCRLPLEPAIQLLHSLKLCSLLTSSCSSATGCPLPQHTFCKFSSTEILFTVLLSGLETSSQLQIACTAMHRTLP